MGQREVTSPGTGCGEGQLMHTPWLSMRAEALQGTSGLFQAPEHNVLGLTVDTAAAAKRGVCPSPFLQHRAPVVIRARAYGFLRNWPHGLSTEVLVRSLLLMLRFLD